MIFFKRISNCLAPLAKHAAMELLSEDLDADFDALKTVLRRVQ